jgi:hypothetical protein
MARRHSLIVLQRAIDTALPPTGLSTPVDIGWVGQDMPVSFMSEGDVGVFSLMRGMHEDGWALDVEVKFSSDEGRGVIRISSILVRCRLFVMAAMAGGDGKPVELPTAV